MIPIDSDDCDGKCLNCGGECFRDEVHNGICMIYGPWGCPDCGWSDWPEYDRSKGCGLSKKNLRKSADT